MKKVVIALLMLSVINAQAQFGALGGALTKDALSAAKKLVTETKKDSAEIKKDSTEAGKGIAASLQPQTAVPPPSLPIIASDPALKECGAVFNTEKKFCYDGNVYDKCDGVVYNPSTHICSNDVANSALCNGMQYNPLTQKCEKDSLLATCGETEYNPTTHGCKDGAEFELATCGTVHYNSETNGCGENSILLAKCDTALYNPATHGCGKDNFAYPKCGEIIYNVATHGCENNVVLAKCDTTLYNSETHGCNKDNAVLPKCGEYLYDTAVQKCENNAVIPLQTETQIASAAVAEQCQPTEGETPKEVRKTHFGLRANGGTSFADGGGFDFPSFGGGIVLLVPISSIYLVQEVSFQHRYVDIGKGITEMAIEVPLLFRFRHKKENVVYLGIGSLFGFVLNSEPNSSNGRHYLSRASVDFGAVTELGFRIGNHFNIDIRTLHSFATDYNYYEYYYNSNGSYSKRNQKYSDYLLQLQLGMSVLF